MQPTLVAIMGPTASGKTLLAESLADQLGWQLINADAFQVYRRMDIGTAKSEIPEKYRLLDICDPWEPFGAGVWIKLAVQELEALYESRQSAIVVGGTLYYIRALLEEYQALHDAPDPQHRRALNERELYDMLQELKQRDPDAARTVDPKNRIRVQRALERLDLPRFEFHLPPFRKVKLGLVPQLIEASQVDPIASRVTEMVEAGWVTEIGRLKAMGVTREDPGMRAHGYRAMWDVFHGDKSLDDAMAETAQEVRQYAKRQRTWLRREPNLVKLPTTEDEGSALATALELLWGSHDGKID